MTNTWLEDQFKDPKFKKLYEKESRKLAKEWREQQLRWLSTLVPGDVIHTCSGKDKVIKEIDAELYAPAWWQTFLAWLPIPYSWFSHLVDFGERYFPVIGEYQVELVDGSFCSGCNCCSPAEGVSYECDECDGSGTYYIDGEPQDCICSERQD